MRDGADNRPDVAVRILDWYDQHARVLPWRINPGDRAAGAIPDPYRIWLSEVMLQQTTVATVRDYFHRFTERWPTVQQLAAADDGDVMGEWAGLGYYARARNLLKCARVITDTYGGRFPESYDKLIELPGIGPYTAAAIAAIAFDQAETVMDGNVERVMARLFEVYTPLPAAKPELKGFATALTPDTRPGDYAQAVMDLGATICTPKSPSCGICPLMGSCAARNSGTAAALPAKTPKKAKPTRYGTVYVVRSTDGAWLMERRPDKGLLGGMLGWPGSPWTDATQEAAPLWAEWSTLNEQVRHTFTHFHLILTVKSAIVPAGTTAKSGFFLQPKDFRPSDLPTVMRKAYNLCREAQ